MINFIWALLASLIVSSISLIGIFSLSLNENFLNGILFLLIGFSAGGLIGAAFLHLLPEAIEQTQDSIIFIYIILGFISFFVLERYLHWRHCHKEDHCDIHAFTYLNLIGDGIHNLADGLIIGSSFVLGVRFGIITTLVIVFHEIPQEIGDFGVLVYGGFSKAKALFYNYISSLTCILGTVIGYILSTKVGSFSIFLLPFIAGGFIYVAACDLIPELHKEPNLKKSTFSFLTFLTGILFILLARLLPAH